MSDNRRAKPTRSRIREELYELTMKTIMESVFYFTCLGVGWSVLLINALDFIIN